MRESKPRWPSPEAAVVLPVDDLALRVLARLTNPPQDNWTRSTRDGFIDAEVTPIEVSRRRRPGRPVAVRSEEARARWPELVRAYAEAWDHCIRQGWLAEDPVRPGSVFITRLGHEQLVGDRQERRRPAVDASSAVIRGAGYQEPTGEMVPAPPSAEGGTTERTLGNTPTVSADHGSPKATNGSQRRSRWKVIVVVAAAVVAVSSGVGAVAGAFNGVWDAADRVLADEKPTPTATQIETTIGGHDPVINAERTPAPSPPEKLSRQRARTAPAFNGVVGHLEGSRRFLRYLRKHDGDAVRLRIALDVESHEMSGNGFTLWTRCWNLAPGAQPSVGGPNVAHKCNGTAVSLVRPPTDDATLYWLSGRAYLTGYFGVDLSSYVAPRRMGFKVVRLKPLVLG